MGAEAPEVAIIAFEMFVTLTLHFTASSTRAQQLQTYTAGIAFLTKESVTMLHEAEIKRQYLTLLADFTTAFPAINPPEPHWWMLWLQRYTFSTVREAIITLSQHPAKDRFTTESTGKAISALLRQSAVRRAMTPPNATGGQS